jgi:hypothetical protein
MSAHYFSDLTPAQQELLSFQGWAPGCGRKAPRPDTARKLVARGLVVPRDVKVLHATVKAYDVPLDVHIAWCAHCARKAGA